ncbi:MAG: ABC transporter permease [Planctomycetaceae bacterium]|nr:ABC transporter permease [Planctomycetaceae bacterium]
MFAGPIFSREALTAPRRLRHYLLRSGYVAFLLVLMYTIRQATIGFQDTKFSGDIASFGSLVFGVFALLQLTLGMFFATLFTAANIAQEKDRRTLILLLMTDMRSRELAYGKLLASLLIVGVLMAASVPVFCAIRLLGGVTWSQVFWAEAIIGATFLASGTWGCLVAFWREKTFQTLAISVLGVVLFVAVVEGVVVISGANSAVGSWVAAASPYRALLGVLSPLSRSGSGVAEVSAMSSVVILLAMAGLLSSYTVIRLRVWNPSQLLKQSATEEESTDEKQQAAAAAASTGRKHRQVWVNPVTWKEIVTRGYGRKVIFIKLAYILLAALIGFSVASAGPSDGSLVLGMVSPGAAAFLAIGVISLLLVNAQAVTSISTERDSNTLDILLATDISAKEFMTGKIIGALWNAREMVLVPILLMIWQLVSGASAGLTLENLIYLIISYSVLCLFAVMLGLHAGLTYENSRSAIGNSLGTMFFLFIGIFVFMLLLVEARSSFAIQMQSFIVFIGLGSIGLYSSLTHKNPSNALTLAAIMLPFLTFYAITDFLLGGSLGVCFWICVAYGFAAIAMLIPSISDFDVALGRTTHDVG